MVFSPDSGLLITGSDDTAARVYNLKPEFPGACQAVLKGHNDGITAIAVAPNGKWLATGSRDQTIRLWSLTDVNAVPNSVVLNGHIGWVSALVIDRNSDVLISGSYDRTIRLWSIPQGNIQKAKDVESIEVQNDQGTVVKLLLSKDGRILVSLGSDASVRLRELNRSIGGAGREIHPKNTLMLRNKILPIQQVMFTPDDRSLVFSYLNLKDESDSGIRIWSLQLDGLLESIKN
jgi:WD40 repeat protein